jgi:LDH2 family malate/lactate/ureidoglycolate dehydrogenase
VLANMAVEWSQLRTWSEALLAAAGLAPEAATDTVANLEYAERRGLVSHGFLRLPTYIDRIRAGGITSDANIQLVSESAVIAVVDADAAIGAHSARRCTDMAIAKAADIGAGIVFARNASHFGAAGLYTDMMAAQGFAGIAACNTDAVMAAPFGGRPVLGTNPLSIAVPMDADFSPNLDMATSAVAHGKIVSARNESEAIPLGWAVDVDGLPTTDPVAGLAGALLPSAGAKGFGLAFMIDCLVAIGGALTSNEVAALYGDPATPQQLGHVFMALAVDQVHTRSEYATRIRSLTEAVHSSVTPGSAAPPLVPGEPSRQRLRSAVEWTPAADTVRQLSTLSKALGVPLPDAISATEVRKS